MNDTYKDRQSIYKKIEKQRDFRVVAYVTGDRPGMQAQIANDAVDLIAEHLDAVFPTKRISLVLYTMGGNTMAAWNLVGLLRMFCDQLEILVPARARSAGDTDVSWCRHRRHDKTGNSRPNRSFFVRPPEPANTRRRARRTGTSER